MAEHPSHCPLLALLKCCNQELQLVREKRAQHIATCSLLGNRNRRDDCDVFFVVFGKKEDIMRKAALLGCLLAGACLLALATDARAQATPPSTGAASSGSAMPVATGNFTGILHKTSGKAIILRTADGGHVLRLEDFRTSNGPDVRVYLVKGTNANNSDFIKAGSANFVDLGALKGNVGNQNYTIPENVNLDDYNSVSIWCRRFAVDFGAASLESVGQPNR
jgi:hypothetical protein